MAFACCSDTLTPEEQKFVLKMPTTSRSASKTRQTKSHENEQMLANELNSIKEMLKSIKTATETNTAEIAAIKSLSTQTEASVKKVTEQNATMMTPTAPAMAYVQQHRMRTYANAVATTPNSAKRKREKSPSREKPQFPAAKTGKKSNANGLQVVPRMDRSESSPKFAKALYVSRLNPATTKEALSDYIVANTSVTDKAKFNVHKMIKKGIDETTLKFVSFKVEMNVEELNVLDDASLWPEGILVREFQQAPKNELGNYFPSLNANDKQDTSKKSENMETA